MKNISAVAGYDLIFSYWTKRSKGSKFREGEPSMSWLGINLCFLYEIDVWLDYVCRIQTTNSCQREGLCKWRRPSFCLSCQIKSICCSNWAFPVCERMTIDSRITLMSIFLVYRSSKRCCHRVDIQYRVSNFTCFRSRRIMNKIRIVYIRSNVLLYLCHNCDVCYSL